ncbi:DUF4189 domain-containing protein [Xanthomonas sp. Kuri4-2]
MRIKLAGLLCFAALMFASLTAYAEGGCPPGSVPVPGSGGQGIQGCAPIPGAGGGAVEQGPVPSGKWIYTWGAIATSDSGTAGAVTGKLSKAQAQREALGRCSEGGVVGCKIALTYHHQCVAIAQAAANPKIASIVSGGSEDLAIKAAMKKCSSSGETCQIFYSACSEPIFQAY